MNTEREPGSVKKENILRKYGLESVLRQFVRSLATTVSQTLRDLLKGMLSRK